MLNFIMKITRALIEGSRLLLFLFCIFIGLTNCAKGKQPVDQQAPSDPDEYYVKYEVNSSTIYMGGKLKVTINNAEDDPETFTIDQRKLSETIIGPVEEGFVATLYVRAGGETHGKLKIFTKIHVSKNNGPFALKANDDSDAPRDIAQLTYKIEN